MSALQPGATFAGYTIERLLGVGGMGEVYVARHPRLPRSDALKVLAAPLAQDENYRQRFAREADLAASLSHHHIVSVHDRGEDDGRLWIALELIDGTDLSDVLDARPAGLEVPEVLRVVGAVADALDFANARGLVHRDVKPANVLLSAAGGVLLTDFGIARMGPESSDLTGTGIALGTVAYASPEQMQGMRIDGRSDQYSLAATAFHLLTGQQPFTGPTAVSVLMAHVNAQVPSVRSVRGDLPPGVDAVIGRAMAKDPALRYTSSRDFAVDLQRALNMPAAGPHWAGSPPASQQVYPPPTHPLTPRGEQYAQTAHGRPAQPPTVDAPAARRGRRGMLLAGIALLAVIALVVGGTLAIRAFGGGDGGEDNRAITPMFGDLAERPTDSIWQYRPGDGFQAVGGNDELIVMAANESAPQLDLHFIDPDDGDNSRPTVTDRSRSLDAVHCEVMGTQAAACMVSDDNAGVNTRVIFIDIDSGQVTDSVSGRDVGQVSVAGDRFVLVRGSAGSLEVESYDRTGDLLDTHEDVREYSSATGLFTYIVDTGGQALSSQSALAFVDAATATEIYRHELEQAFARPAVQFFVGGFAIADDEGPVEIFDRDGQRTAEAGSDYELLDTARPQDVGGMTANALPRPMVAVSEEVVAALDPDTGEPLWEQPAGDTVRTAIGTGTAVALGSVVRDCYTGELLGEAGRMLLGTDGTRTASLSTPALGQVTNRTLIVNSPDRGTWELEELAYRPLAVGGRLFHGSERLL